MFNETINLSTSTNLSVIEENHELSLSKAKKYVERYQKAAGTFVKGAWNLAKVVYDTVNACDFKEAFGNLDTYAKAIGVTKATISKYQRAYSLLNVLIEEKPDDFASVTVGQVQELLPIAKSDLGEFIEVHEITGNTPAKEIRKFVKQYTNGEEEELENDEQPEESATVASDETEDSRPYFEIYVAAQNEVVYVTDYNIAVQVRDALLPVLGKLKLDESEEF